MDANFWHTCWEHNRLGFHQDEIHPLLEQYIAPIVENSDKNVFIPLCGKSLDILWWGQQVSINQGQIIGCELSEIACHDFFVEQGLVYRKSQKEHFQRFSVENIHLWQGDIFKLSPEYFESFDFIYDRAALIAWPYKSQQAYVDKLKQFVGENTKLVLLTLEFPIEELEGPPFPLSPTQITELFDGYKIECLVRKPIKDKKFGRRNFAVSHLAESLYLISNC